LLFGDDNESLPQQNDTDANQGESVAASALDTATITNTAINARPKTVFGFSRFAKKNKNPVVADANATTNKISNEETNTESKRIVVTPNHGVRSNVSSIDKTNTIKSHEGKGNNSNDSNDNVNSNSNSTHNGNNTQNANNKSPPQASKASTSLVATANHPPPVAMELDAASPHFNHEAARANNSRRVSLEEYSPSLPERRPFLQPRAAEANQMPQDKSKQQQQQRESEIKKTNIGGDGRPAFNPDTPSILGQSSRGVGVGNSRTRRISNGAAMQANGNELPLSRQQEKNEERRQLRREEYANVTDNRIMRKNVLSGATAVTPNNSFVVRNVPHKDIGYENQNQTEIPTTTTTFGIAPSQEMTTILPETFDRGSRSEMAGRTSTSSTGIDINNSSTSTTSLESNQEARFLTTIRETEDLQEKIEVDLLGMNDRFSEHYALLLRDLDVAVDLLDKLEDIEKFANETIANYQHCRPSITS
jgi:hypothetical protein